MTSTGTKSSHPHPPQSLNPSLLALCRKTLGSERHRYAIAQPDKLGTGPMNGRRRGIREESHMMYVSTRFSLSMEISRLTRDGTAKPVSQDQIFRRKRGEGKKHFPCSADHEQDWQPCPVDPYSCCCCCCCCCVLRINRSGLNHTQ